MIDLSKLSFVINSLDLGVTETAKAIGISQSHLSYIVLGRDKPSLDVALKLEGYLKQIWQERKGQTVPPEVQRIVFELLYPPAPFNPFDGPRKPGKQPKEKKECAPEAAGLEPKLNGTAALFANEETNNEIVPITPAEEWTATDISGVIQGVSVDAIKSWTQAAQLYAQIARCKPVSRSAMTALRSHVANQSWGCDADGVTLSDPAIQKRLARRADVQLRDRQTDAGTQRRNQALIEIISPRVSQHRRDSHNKGAGEYSLGSLRSIINGVLSEPETQRLLNEHSDIHGGFPKLPMAKEETNAALALVERLLREHRGGSNRNVEHMDHLERTIGFRAQYAGQVAIVDATGWPVQFISGNETKKHKEWIYLNVDVASGLLRAANICASSESEGWRPNDNPEKRDVMMLWLKEMGYFPEWLINDRISTLTDGLRDLKPGCDPRERLSDGVLLWLAGGVRPYVRMGGRPTGGAHVERNVRTTKDALAELGTQRAVSLEAKGLGLKKLYDVDHRLEFLAQLQAAIAKVNAAQFKRRGCPFTRAELSERETGVSGRAQRVAASDLWRMVDNGVLKWRRIISGAKVGMINAGRLHVRINNKAWTAELVEPDGGWPCKVEERDALILPSGARQGDDPESFRVIVLEKEKARIEYHPCEARSVKLDEYFQDLAQPIIGDFRARPQGAADKFAKVRDADSAGYREHVRQLKQATTDEPVEAISENPFA